MPSNPPTAVSVAASTRNWNRISARVAPSALRMPISRVRSVTDTIMIAITPMPPTRSATLDRAIITRKNAEVSLSMMPRIWSWVRMSKLLGVAGCRPRTRRSAMIVASLASSIATPRAATTTMNNDWVSS